MRAAKRTFVILSLALAGCRGSVVATSPTPVTASVRLFVEQSATPLLHDLAAGYHPERTLVGWQFESGSYAALDRYLATTPGGYAVTNYLPADSAYWSTPIGQDALALIVNDANPIAGLSGSQLRAVFAGRVQNWREIGGADLPLQVVARPYGSGEGEIFRSLVMGERLITGAAQLATSSQRVIDLVAANRGAVGFASIRYMNGAQGVHTIAFEGVLPSPDTLTTGQYGLRSPLLFVGRQAPGDNDYRRFFAWVQSRDGQAIVMKNHGGLGFAR